MVWWLLKGSTRQNKWLWPSRFGKRFEVFSTWCHCFVTFLSHSFRKEVIPERFTLSWSEAPTSECPLGVESWGLNPPIRIWAVAAFPVSACDAISNSEEMPEVEVDSVLNGIEGRLVSGGRPATCCVAPKALFALLLEFSARMTRDAWTRAGAASVCVCVSRFEEDGLRGSWPHYAWAEHPESVTWGLNRDVRNWELLYCYCFTCSDLWMMINLPD